MCFSDAFDLQFGVVLLRLKEGLDISHIQGGVSLPKWANGLSLFISDFNSASVGLS